MSYETVKKGLGDLLESLEISPSKQLVDFVDASPNEHNNTYILKCLAGNVDEELHGDLGDRLYDIEEWTINVMFSRGEYSTETDFDKLHKTKEDIIQKVDKPDNWTSFVRTLRYTSWEIQEFADYFVLVINIEVTDTITY